MWFRTFAIFCLAAQCPALRLAEVQTITTYCVLPAFPGSEAYVLLVLPGVLLEASFDAPQGAISGFRIRHTEYKNGLVKHAVEWKLNTTLLPQVPIVAFSSVSDFPKKLFELFLSVTSWDPKWNRVMEMLPAAKEIYIPFEGKNDVELLTGSDALKKTQEWLAGFLGCRRYPDRFNITSIEKTSRGAHKSLYVIKFLDRALRASQAGVNAMLYNWMIKKPDGLTPVTGIITETLWLQSARGTCLTVGGVGYWHVAVALLEGKETWVLLACELECNWRTDATCTNTRKAVVKVTGRGADETKGSMQVPVAPGGSAGWRCSVWTVPSQWGDESAPGAQKLGSVDSKQTELAPRAGTVNLDVRVQFSEAARR